MYRFSDAIYPSRNEWSEYSIFNQRALPEARNVIIKDWKLPDIVINNNPVTKLAIVVNSNLGLKNASAAERNSVYAGSHLRQFVLNKENSGWTLQGSPVLDYPTLSSTFTFRLRYWDSSFNCFMNVPVTPKKKWEITIQIV
jgi:hypothetical protein